MNHTPSPTLKTLSGESLELLSQLSAGFVLLVDDQQNILHANAAWQEHFGDLPLPSLPEEEEAARWQAVFTEKVTENASFHLAGKKVSIRAEKVRYEGQEVLLITGSIEEQSKAIRDLLYRLITLSSSYMHPDTYYKEVHEGLQTVIDAPRFTIISFGTKPNSLRIAYHSDTKAGKNVKKSLEHINPPGLSRLTISEGKTFCQTRESIEQLAKEGLVKLSGPAPAAWMGIPLRIDRQIGGLLVISSTTPGLTYTDGDISLMESIARQVALGMEHRNRERQITSQASRLDAIFRSSKLLIWTVDQKGSFTYYNDRFQRTIEENYGMIPIHNGSYFIPEGKTPDERFIRFWERKYEKAFKGKTQHFEKAFKAPRSQKSWKEVIMTPISSRDGQIEEISCIALDITDSKINKQQLQESEEMFRNIFESFQDVYFRCNMQGELTLISPSVQEMLGYEPDAMMDKDIRDYYLYTSKTKDLLRQLIRRKSVRNFEASIITRQGEILQCICNVRLIYNKQGRPVEVEGVARDITQLKKTNQELVKQKEIAERSLRVKEQFLANMSHEIRTPMNGIIGVVDLLYNTELELEQEDYVNTIKKSSETLLAILNDILDLSKIEAGKMRLRTAPVILSEVMEKVFALFGQQANNNAIDLSYQIDTELPVCFHLDETRLLQVFSNLTSNAIKFSQRGGAVSIELKAEEHKGENYVLKATVTDSGIGISDKDQRKLFTSFNQLDNSSTKSYKGTGLGLAISKELCRLMGGRIGVDSTPGEGSTFWFTFKAKVSKELPEKQQEQDRRINLKNSALWDLSPLVLLVDDNAINRQVATEILKKAGCQVHMADSGQAAIDLVAQHRYKIIYMDIQMPGMDGVETTQHLREKHGDALPPVVAMTAYSMRDDRERFLSQGLDDYLSKPIQARTLIAKTEEIILNKAAVEIKPTEEENNTTPEVIISQEVVDQLSRYGGMEMVRSALGDFETEATEQIALLQEEIDKANYKGILSILHTMKGNAGTLGLLQLAACTKLFEARIKASEYNHIPDDIRALKAAFEAFKKGLSNLKGV